MSLNDPNFYETYILAELMNIKLLKTMLNLKLDLAKSLSKKIEKKLDKAFEIRKSKKKQVLKTILRKIEAVIKKIKDMLINIKGKRNFENDQKVNPTYYLTLDKEVIDNVCTKNNIIDRNTVRLECINNKKEKNIKIPFTK